MGADIGSPSPGTVGTDCSISTGSMAHRKYRLNKQVGLGTCYSPRIILRGIVMFDRGMFLWSIFCSLLPFVDSDCVGQLSTIG